MSTAKTFDVRSNLKFSHVALAMAMTKHAQKLQCTITQTPEVNFKGISLGKSYFKKTHPELLQVKASDMKIIYPKPTTQVVN